MLDDRTGSGDLAPYLRSRGVPVISQRMEYGDAAFFGNGPDQIPVPIGIEVKQVSDVLQCITDGRFAGHQLPGLCATYEHTWLVIEGSYRRDEKSGILQTFYRGQWRDYSLGARKFMHRELVSWLLTMQIKGGIRIEYVFNRGGTADFIADLYKWWTNKDYAEHRSHLAAHVHTPDHALLTRPTLSRMVAKELPGIGWERSAAVAKAFPTVLELAVAEEDDWSDISGIGPKTAAKVVRAIRTGKTD